MRLLLLFSFVVTLLIPGVSFAQGDQSVPKPSRGYMLGPGDEITVKVLGEQDFDFKAEVNSNGFIRVPISKEPVLAVCRTEEEMWTVIEGLLGKYLKEPNISLQVTRRTVIPATVAGEVNSPKEIELRRRASLVEVLAVAGGPRESAGGTIKVFRPIKPLCAENESNWVAASGDPNDTPYKTFSIASLSEGGGENNPVIYPGDVVLVEKAAPVYITGEVVAPQGLYIKERGLTVREAIHQIGGPRPDAKTKDIRIQRRKPNSTEVETISVNYDLIVAGQAPDVQLQPYDVVDVGVKKDSVGVALFKFAVGLGKAASNAAITGGAYRAVIY